jgi:hypothetical protein
VIIAGRFSFNGGEEAVQQKYPHLLAEIEAAIQSVDAEQHRSKKSMEKTMMGKMLYNPSYRFRVMVKSYHERDIP